MTGRSRYGSLRGLALSRKQVAIMEHVIDRGLNSTQIAELSGMARSTVDTHLARVRAKLGARTTEQAAVLFDRERRKEQA